MIGESKEQDKVQGEVEEPVESPESSVDESSVADDHSAQEQTVESTEPTLDSRPETTTDSALQPTETEESAADTSSSEGAQDLKSAEPFDVVTPSETVKNLKYNLSQQRFTKRMYKISTRRDYRNLAKLSGNDSMSCSRIFAL
ncbi:Signal recognition particle receptor proteinFtsY(alpha subunit) [Enterococcus sp. HSIEG1]|nr:Signal recognition particle receptor proteinFtsY(alpha subunit) [Enterococcus sp. HSIEG1]